MSSESDIHEFIDKYKALLLEERNEEIERSSLLLSNSGPKLLELKGLALGGLGVVEMNIGLGGKTLVELERPLAHHTTPSFPPHTFSLTQTRPGDLARIEANAPSNASTRKPKKGTAPTDTKAVEGVVYKVSDTRIMIAVDQSDTSDDIDLPQVCRVLKLANSVTYDRMNKALETLEKTATDPKFSANRTRLMEVLLGISQPSKPLPLPEITFFDESLNESQKAAVRFTLESLEVACIHGPPGTGKTHTLIEIIRQLTSVSPANPKPQRLLVCGASNLSVDNILERLLALPAIEKGEKLKVTRVGHPARVMAHQGVLESTLDAKAGRSEQAALAKDIKNEIDAAMGFLTGKGKGVKGKGPRGAERKKLWEEVKALRKEYRQREGGVVKSVLGESQVVLATCHSSGGRQLNNQQFDVVLIDEATQALEAVCWISIFKAKKLILAGDPMQLPPTILSINTHEKSKTQAAKSGGSTASKSVSKASPKPEDNNPDISDDSELSDDAEPSSTSQVASSTAAAKGRKASPVIRPPRTLETTLFDRLEKMYGSKIKRMLTIQYRMHEQICTFPSKTLYHSKLKSHSSVAGHLLLDLPNTHADSEEDEKDVLATPVIFFDTSGCEYYERVDGEGDEGSRSNENEAMVVKQWVDKLVSAGVLPEQIAVITPYQAQVTLLSTLLRPVHGQSLEIGTVDGMQGREKEAVVISLVRSNDRREVGFLKEKRRLNVAMTRAKRSLCVVGDSSTICHGGPFLKKWLAWLEANADVRYGGLD
ncbi:P-loop containing nucleoside triphosphate hydrolase protein [Pleurotus eryngii]|uniref:DNA helicase n=1 Tax=Pleurotus eryngii TaxID=5323 RepID=A0A9P5ZUR1_PLEER|nr:P-loop containing nucleoside triphosphate hydrolase protein [Pleurotus eryngii]